MRQQHIEPTRLLLYLCGKTSSQSHKVISKSHCLDDGENATVFGYPVSICFIVLTGFFERFSYYCMNGMLVFYFIFFLNFNQTDVGPIKQAFDVLFYLTPILGAAVAELWLGKFKTIIYLTSVYVVGLVILTLGASHDITDNLDVHRGLSVFGLLVIALGIGGFSPCMVAFGGDQFQDHQKKQRSSFFSIVYMSINTGVVAATFLNPVLRGQECGIHSQQRCFPLAFGVPAALMAVALILFVAGIRMYNKTESNIVVRKPKIAEVKMVLKVLLLYIPLPVFWTLFEWQRSRWVFQTDNMAGNFGALVIQPDQMQIAKPVLSLILVPIMDLVIYPMISKCKLNFTPLRRITVGMFFVALAFVASALVQIQIDKTLPTFPSSTEAQVKFINMVNRTLDVKAGTNEFTLEPYTVLTDRNYPNIIKRTYRTRSTIVIIQDGAQPRPLAFNDFTQTPRESYIRFFNGFGSNLNILLEMQQVPILPNDMSHYFVILQENDQFKISNDAGEECVYTYNLMASGSSYTLIIPPTFTFGQNCEQNILSVKDIETNKLSIGWQVPQYFLLALGELMVYVTGLDFSYTQAPRNMKSVVQAGWLLTIGVSNIILTILNVAEVPTLQPQWAEYVLTASLLVLVCIIFAIMAYFYTYTDQTKIEAEFGHNELEDRKRKSSVGQDKHKLSLTIYIQKKETDMKRKFQLALDLYFSCHFESLQGAYI
uniref:Solute carrier family 15 member 1 n=1 Tax=Anabas testudineus TaxID=64144 RepID=A0A7N6F979_ANATE